MTDKSMLADIYTGELGLFTFFLFEKKYIGSV